MEPSILYHRKMKPPRIMRRPRPCLQTRTRFCRLRLQIRATLYTRKRKNRAVRAALPKTHPKITHHSRKEDVNYYRQSASAVNEKAAGAPYSPTAHAIPDATAEATSRYLKNVGSACSKPQDTRCRHKKRCPYYTRFRRVLSTHCGPLFLAAFRDLADARAAFDFRDACNACKHRHDSRKRRRRPYKRPINPAKRGARSDYRNGGLCCRLQSANSSAPQPLLDFVFHQNPLQNQRAALVNLDRRFHAAVRAERVPFTAD